MSFQVYKSVLRTQISATNLRAMKIAKKMRLQLLLLFWMLLIEPGGGQEYREFPKLFNIAVDKPIATRPSQSTCGVPTRSAYCKSSTFPNSVTECRQDFCVQDCPRRTSLPFSYTDMFIADGFGVCVTADAANLRPGARDSEYSVIFRNNTKCVLKPLNPPNFGANGAFTLTLWVWQEQGNIGTIVEKKSESGALIFRVELGDDSVVISYRTALGQQHVQFTDSIPVKQWVHVGVQGYGRSLSYFINGLGVGFSPRGTRTLTMNIMDGAGTFQIGQGSNGMSQFVGRLQDVRFYGETLTNREIAEVYSGKLPEIMIQSQCRCPATHPRVKPLQTRNCIRNGVPDNMGDELLRLSKDSHPLQYINDGDPNSIWISGFMDDVTVEVNLQDQFQVFFVVLQFYSPLPKVVTIERRKTPGSPWQTWQMYAEDCPLSFGIPNNGDLQSPTSINCLQFGTKGQPISYSRGNITFNMLSSEPVRRPDHNNFYNSQDLKEFVKATAVRVRLQEHFHVNHQRHKYYGVYEFIVTGRCDCHGHTKSCDTTTLPYKCDCLPESNTEGDRCEKCKPLFNDKPFRSGDTFEARNCKACKCYGHADICIYNKTIDSFPDDHDRGGGGICQNCKHNTRGRHCNHCIQYFYREVGKSLYSEDVCTPCNCYTPGIIKNNFDCEKVGGQCNCRPHVSGRRCDRCADGYYNMQESNPVGCEACSCNTAGTVNANVSCHQTLGQCQCKRNVRGRRCNACQYGFFNLDGDNPNGCSPCNCDPQGSTDEYCDPGSGKCTCKQKVTGRRCDGCADNYFKSNGSCESCGCDPLGTEPGTTCNKVTGQCTCKLNVQGRQCNVCKAGFYTLGSSPENGCQRCGCHPAGTLNGSSLCDKVTGHCICKANVVGKDCNQCKDNTWGLKASNKDGCQPCNCDVTGTQGLKCDQNSGDCTCLQNRYGRTCDRCQKGTYRSREPEGGCIPCRCHKKHTVGSNADACDPETGQCECVKSMGAAGRACDACIPTYYKVSSSASDSQSAPENSTCAPCGCSPAGSLNATCNAAGDCFCKKFVKGTNCSECKPNTSQMDADNPYGCSKAPSQQPPPKFKPINSTAVLLEWGPPDYPNGVILGYKVYRDGKEIGSVKPTTANMTYTDTGLHPYTEYSYRIGARNAHGDTISPEAKIRTEAGAPVGSLELRITNVGTRSAVFRWTEPEKGNGIVEKYQLMSTDTTQPHWTGIALQRTLDNLVPFTNYSFYIQACTVAGCLNSSFIHIQTLMDVPEAQDPPDIIPLSSTELLIEWKPPNRPNGIIIFYELWMRGMPGPDGKPDPKETRLFHPAGQFNPNKPLDNALPPPETNFTITGLEPYTQYQFLVLAENSVGKVSSPWTIGRTMEDVPLLMYPPDIFPVNNATLNITWTPPTEKDVRGKVVQYTVYQKIIPNRAERPFAPPFLWKVLSSVSADQLWMTVDGLGPYSQHSFMVEMCNNVGCVNSTENNGTTLAAAPEDMSSPKVVGINYTSIALSWNPPAKFNGPAPTYSVTRMEAAFSHPPYPVTRGTRFPGNGYYLFPPNTIKQGVEYTGIDLWFRTSHGNGLILFAASPGNQEEFIAVQLREKRPWFLFDPQGCVAGVTVDTPEQENITFSDGRWHHLVVRRSTTFAQIIIDDIHRDCNQMVTTTNDEGAVYSDGEWHHLRVTRTGGVGKIILDDIYIGLDLGDSQGKCQQGNIIGQNSGVYIGGLPEDFTIVRPQGNLEERLQIQRQGFIGCLRDIQFQCDIGPDDKAKWCPLDWNTAVTRSSATPSWEGCPATSATLTQAMHFLGKGYIILGASYVRGGISFAFEMDIRTTVKNGLLFFVYGESNNYVYAQLVSGQLHFAFMNGQIRGNAVFPEIKQICDGKWKSIVFSKRNTQLTITVDGESRTTGSGNNRASVLVFSDVFFGGIPQGSDVERYIRQHNLPIYESFAGCIGNIRYRRPVRYVDLNKGLLNVNLDGCPLDTPQKQRCMVSVPETEIYNGPKKSAMDHGLSAFTEYLYKVEAYNDMGSTSSVWTIGRSREGPPGGVSGPSEVKVHSGYLIVVTWEPPTVHTGQLTEYYIRAYNRDILQEHPVQKNISAPDNTDDTYSQPLTAQIKVVPFTNYTVKIAACTRGGCKESDLGYNVTTQEEAPNKVKPPHVVAAGGTYIVVGWDAPGMPNGRITGYVLFKEGAEIYRGNLRSGVNVTDLKVYTGYQFRVRACTKIGCTDGTPQILKTAQLPPTRINPPVLTVLGTKKIKVEWERPEEMNGNLESYLLHSSLNQSDVGEVVYNSSALFQYYTLDGLVAGTLYYIRVTACTGGGCTTSDPSSASTVESAPEGIHDPKVTSPSPSQLLVSWAEPELPNGIITQYKLYHNSLLTFNTTAATSHLLDNLQPWSLHTFRLEVCTARGCGSSNQVQARTQEAPPQGFVGLQVKVEGPREVSVKWTAPAVPNGPLVFKIYFSGLFYKDPENHDYSTVNERRSLNRSEKSGVWIRIQKLIPFSTYTVQANASNAKGYIVSNAQVAQMPMGSPDGVIPPTLTSPTPRSIRATWRSVGRANANQQPVFQLQFRRAVPPAVVIDVFPQPTTATTYLKEDLEPFFEYEFRLLASNTYGQTQSPWVALVTKQDKPGTMDPPLVNNIGAQSVQLLWQHPLKPNGIITEYKIYQNNMLSHTVPGNTSEMILSGLKPDTTYIFTVEACTVAGCTRSPESMPVKTNIAAPEDIPTPALVSHTPTSVLITWKKTKSPNGEIINYKIERRKQGENDTSLVWTVSPSDQMQYVDDSPDITPYTVYEYRILATNRAGTGTGPWAQVTTRSSRPGGVRPPLINVIGPTTVMVTWDPPIRANGQLEYYIIKMPEPRVEIRNLTQFSLLVKDLIPYTKYSVTLTACTDGGCTESTEVEVMTDPAQPSGLSPPVPTPHSQTYISVLWEPPARPNGPSLRYELQRMKMSQPLDASASEFYKWETIYSGDNTYFEDRGLTIYTIYQYRITVFNSYGHMTSKPCPEVATFGGTPRKAAEVTASPVDHTSILVEWKTPTVQELQGGVTQYIINATHNAVNKTVTGQPDDSNVTVSGLMPNTQYQVRVTIVVHGGATITSQPVSVVTLDGAPEGMQPPQLFVVNETALRVVWSEPQNPNGRVLGYNVYLDGIKIPTGLKTPGSYILTNLRPYTIYRVQVEVCTVYSCLKSTSTNGTTAEAVPQILSQPNAQAMGSTVVTVTWAPPGKPNGIILNYELLRRAKIPCSQQTKPNNTAPSGKCKYVACKVQESHCGTSCFSGPKTCCHGNLYDNKPGHECCGSSYVPGRSSFDDICCGGRYFRQKPNYQCCGQRYVEVRPGHVCCPDPREDRVSVGVGDSCCNGNPYPSKGPQICCNGDLHDGFKKQCCGNEVISHELLCCGNGTRGKAHRHDSKKFCCGTEYVATDIAVCCTSDTGKSKVHVYANTLAKLTTNEKCCGTERISGGLECCNSVGYNPLTQVCADRSDGDAGCGTGVVCPYGQASQAFCNHCDFDRTTQKCGSVLTTQDLSTTETETKRLIPQHVETCLTSPVRIYRGKSFKFQDTKLTAFTEYQYAMVAVNGAGSGVSEYTTVTTHQTRPEGVKPPRAEVRAGQLDSVYLSWEVPAKPNGEILSYVLYRDGVEIFRDRTTLSYQDNNAIQPYRIYSYIISACTVEGCTSSTTVQVATLEARPEQVLPPAIRVVSSTSLHLTWTNPVKPNGIIQKFIITEKDKGTLATITNGNREYSHIGLEPFTEYEYWLTACTSAGCSNSSHVTGKTAQAPPSGVSAPRVVIVTANEVEVHWMKPKKANGIILAYRLYRSMGTMSYTIAFASQAGVYNTRETSLAPTAQYQYKVGVVTGGGATNSTITVVQMPARTPHGIGAPFNVTALSSTSVYVAWGPPAQPNGPIDQYKVLLNPGLTTEVEKGVGLSMTTVIDKLEPYTQYAVHIRACLQGVRNGCGTGAAMVVVTKQDIPVGQQPPVLKASGSTVVELTWKPPTKPNGIITGYRIHRRLSGAAGQGFLINIVSGTMNEFTNAGPELLPYTVYEYRLTAVNVIGESVSDWAMVRTMEAPPVGMPSPVVTVVGSHTLNASWGPPRTPNGVIVRYRVEFQAVYNDPTRPNPLEVVTVTGSQRNTTISGLLPYKSHRVRVTAMNSVSSVQSPWVAATTLQAAPSGVGKFDVEKISTGTSVILRWNLPVLPNGIIDNYMIYEKDNPNPIYQGLSREFEYRRLQPFTTYHVQLEACTEGGCAKGEMYTFKTAEIPPTSQSVPVVTKVTASAVSLRWKKPGNANGVITLYEVLRRSFTRDQKKRKKRAITQAVVVYNTTVTGNETFHFTDTGLKAYTRYEYKIRTYNIKGSTESPWYSVQTDQMAPQGLSPPRIFYIGNKYDELRVTWSEPTSPNGVLQNYKLQRNDTVPWSFTPDDPKEHVDRGLVAYTWYSYIITSCTAGGCTSSEPAMIRTQETVPYSVKAPTLTPISSTVIQAEWISPQITNGAIQKYNLLVDNVTKYSGMDMSYNVTGLTPYKLYEFVLAACTNGGCANSVVTSARPFEDKPKGLKAPVLRVMSSTSIEIKWQLPEFPNGIITSYELRRDETLVESRTLTHYTDYGLTPGKLYSYTVTAFNSKGSVMSPVSSATTYASSPSGLDPPELSPISSTAIRVTWKPPVKPNGEIYNYTLYKDTEVVFSGKQLSFTVKSLADWTEYSFRVQACTLKGCVTSEPVNGRTLEAIPEEQEAPKLQPQVDASGAHSGVLIKWQPPRKPNGVIVKYEVYRRDAGLEGPGTTSKRIYSGPQEQYLDRDDHLQPFTYYLYKVAAYNKQGHTESDWERVQTAQAPPEGIKAPKVKSTTGDTITITIDPPRKPNGYIDKYNIIVNGEVEVSSKSDQVILGEDDPLEPFREYKIAVEACTMGGCSTSPTITAKTRAVPPEGMAPPVLTDITNTTILVKWTPPTKPNGVIKEYELYMKQVCPHPYADPADPVKIACTESVRLFQYKGLSTQYQIVKLLPYTRYQVELQVYNYAGGLKDPVTASAVTNASAPVYKKENPPTLQCTGNVAIVDWSNSFYINGEIREFVLYKDGKEEYRGYNTKHNVFRTLRWQSHQFQVKLVTNQGEVRTPVVILDPSQPNCVGTPPPTTDTPEKTGITVPFYEDIWFIVVICLVGLAILFIIMILCCKYCVGHRVPYIREHMPLQPRQKKVPIPFSYGIDPYNGSISTTDIPPQLDDSHSTPRHNTGLENLAHVGYVNPAFSQLSMQNGSVMDLTLEKMSQRSSHWDDDYNDGWDRHVLPDSGLHSLTYGEEYDTASDRPFSVIKEHSIFTDTHV